MDYGELKSNIASYSHRSNLANSIPLAIKLAQGYINATLRSTLQDENEILALKAGAPLVVLPDRYLAFRSLRLLSSQQGVMLNPDGSLALNPDGTQAYNPDGTLSIYKGGHRSLKQQSLYQNSLVFESLNGVQQTPTHYALNGRYIEVCPAPPTSMLLFATYRARRPNFTYDKDTDRVLQEQPLLYVYATMRELSLIIKDDKAVNRWHGMYRELVDSLNDLSEESEYSGAPLQYSNSDDNP